MMNQELENEVVKLRQKKEELEAIIDSYTLARVLEMLGEICGEKADHIRENLQDEWLALLWERAGNKVAALRCNYIINRVS